MLIQRPIPDLMNVPHVPGHAVLGQELAAPGASDLLVLQHLALAGGEMPDVEVPATARAVGATNLVVPQVNLGPELLATQVALLLKKGVDEKRVNVGGKTHMVRVRSIALAMTDLNRLHNPYPTLRCHTETRLWEGTRDLTLIRPHEHQLLHYKRGRGQITKLVP